MLLLTNKTIDKLKYDLVREGVVDLDKLNLAQENAEKNSTSLAVELLKENILSEQNLLEFIQGKLHIPYVELSDYEPDPACLRYVTLENAKKYNIFPLFKIEDVLTIAMSDPLDLFAINNLFELDNLSIEPVVCAEKAIKNAIAQFYENDATEQEDLSWQEKFLSGDLKEESINEIISDIIKDAIEKNCEQIYMERSNGGMSIYFAGETQGFLPNILVPRFVFELANNYAGMTSIDEEIPQNTRFDFQYKNDLYSVILSLLPTKFGARISMLINPPIKEIDNKLKNNILMIMQKPSFIGIDKSVQANFVYSLANFLSAKYKVVMIESVVKYNISNVAQLEVSKNTGIYFDEIIKQIELQDFDVVFWEKIYTKDQFEKLKLLSKERTIFTTSVGDDIGKFDFDISSEEKIA